MERQMTTELRKIISNPEGVDDIFEHDRVLHFKVSLKDLKDFVSIPWYISWYRSSESRKIFPPVLQEMTDLNPDFTNIKKLFPGFNPFFVHLEFLQYYIALKDGKKVGRIAAIIDNNYREKKFEGKVGIISLFEAEDEETGKILIKEAVEDLKKHGALKIVGPMRFNATGEAGLLIQGFEIKPMPMEPYNPPYYKEIFDQFGEKENDWYSFLADFETVGPYIDRISNFTRNGESLEDFIFNNGIRIRNVTLKNFDEEAEKVKHVYNLAWDTIEHPQFEKFTDAEFRYIANSLKTALVPDFIFLVEEESSGNCTPIGISVTIPNINEVIEKVDNRYYRNFIPSGNPLSLKDVLRDLRILKELKSTIKNSTFKTARIYILGTLKKKKGIDAILYKRTFENGLKYNLAYSSASQVADTNLNMVNPLVRMGKTGFVWRVYRLR